MTTFQNGLYDHLLKASDNYDELKALALSLAKSPETKDSYKGMSLFIQDMLDLRYHNIAGACYSTRETPRPPEPTSPPPYHGKRYFITFSSAEMEDDLSVIGASKHPNPGNHVFTDEPIKASPDALLLFSKHFSSNPTSLVTYNRKDIDDRQIDIYDSKKNTIRSFHTDNREFYSDRTKKLKL